MKPGFSTAEKVTNVSGRGVGMDVVRSNIEKIGGTLEFRSAWTKGSTFTIKIPLTLAIVSALIVETTGQRFAIPQIAVREVVRATGNTAARIESLSGAPVLRLRDHLLPLLNLSSVLQLSGENAAARQVVVCRSGTQNFGVVVDHIADAEEIVVKPMSNLTKGSGVFSGNTVLGDGTVILILDVNTLSQRLTLDTSKTHDVAQDISAQASKAENILLFRGGGEGVKAVALTSVHRIEHFAMDSVEWVQGQPVVQYRQNMLPLMAIDGLAGIRSQGNQHVLVFTNDHGSVGLAIDSLEDIVSAELRIASPSRRPGIAGSQIVAGRAVDYVDPAFFLASIATSLPEATVLGEAA
jgi:two-component system chemotaxis sensor kinase CheA